jgi:putative hydrolase of the HAD superfamily
MAVKNVLFDFGQVLVWFDTKYMVNKYVEDEDDRALLSEVIFDRLYWDRLDLGTISDEETMACVLKRLPRRLWDVAETIYYNWIYNIPEVPGMRELIKYIKEKYGVHVYVLSNISKYFASHSHEIPILREVEGCVFSSSLGIVKPDIRIYQHVCEKFGIEASETIFVDDSKPNIIGAANAGMGGFLFGGDAEPLKAFLDEQLAAR